MTVNKIEIESRVILEQVDGNAFQIKDTEGNILVERNENWHVYMVAVNLRNNGNIEARLSGYNPKAILDKHCYPVFYKEGKGWETKEGVQIRTARMIAVENNNQNGVMVVIKE